MQNICTHSGALIKTFKGPIPWFSCKDEFIGLLYEKLLCVVSDVLHPEKKKKKKFDFNFFSLKTWLPKNEQNKDWDEIQMYFIESG